MTIIHQPEVDPCPEPPIDEPLFVTVPVVKGCLRCGGTHKNVKFKLFKKANWKIDNNVRWAMCPETQEPMLLKVVQ